MLIALSVLGGLLVGACVAWYITSTRVTKNMTAVVEAANHRANTAESGAAALQATVEELRQQLVNTAKDFETLRSKMEAEQGARVKAETQLSETILRLNEERKVLEEAKIKFIDAFKAVAGDTLNESTTAFLKLAKESFDKIMTDAKGDMGIRHEAFQGLVKPLSESLKQFNEHIREIEKSRQESYAGLTEQLKGVSQTQQQLRIETANLVTALRRPEVRGRWGELTLRRVVELSGMSKHCDFGEQVSVDTENGRQRPDMIVNLPSDRQIVVDSKAPIDAYIDATQAGTEEQRKSAMERHATQVRGHMDKLASKTYWDQFAKAPEFVVMFIAGESFFGAAVEIDSAIMEDALQKHIVIATPATLIALLRAVAYGWRQEQIAENAQTISELGKQLFERMSILAEYIDNIGRSLEKATEAYNKSVSSLETRVLTSARRFKDLGISSSKEIPLIETLQIIPRSAPGQPRIEGNS
jgi:DNA recombination protein RmuC